MTDGSPDVRIAVLDDHHRVSTDLADWASLGDDVEVVAHERHIADRDALVATLADFDVVALMRERTPFPADVIDRLPRLRLLLTSGMANASIDLEVAGRAGVTVCGTPGALTPMIEHTWALVFGVLRDLPRLDAAIRQGRWQEGTRLGVELNGSRLGLLGLGRSGGAIATQAQAFGAEVVAWSQNLTDERAAEVGAVRVTKDELFATSDVLVIALKLSERTQGLVGVDELGRMKPTARLVNASRGPIVDEAALVDALREGRIAGAGIDVFDDEPLAPDHPLLALDNVVLTPHMGYVTRDQYERFYPGMVEDVAAYRAGEPIRVLNADWLQDAGEG
ncbi:MAG: D-2-hydroxyacid dehydrogenase family protein [Nitriliruptoraceae bacterium]